MRLDADAAQRAVGDLGRQTGMRAEALAEGIIRIANEHMARALRVISVQRGIDPRGFTLVSFGGAGGLHVCALADALGMRQALVPVHAGVLSALGMLATRPGRQLVRTWPGLIGELEERKLWHALDTLAEEGKRALREEGLASSDITSAYSLDLRYLGQSYTLNLPWYSCVRATADFHAQHEARYGHRMDAPVELVNLRVALAGPETSISLPMVTRQAAATAIEWLSVEGVEAQVPRYERAQLAVGQCIVGPALITEMASTTWLAEGWDCLLDERGNLMLSRTAV
jgi:N-methylhydantoinase A